MYLLTSMSMRPFAMHAFTPYFEKHAHGAIVVVVVMLEWFNLAYAVFLCDYTTSCEAYSFTTDEYGIFNVCTNVGACHTHEEFKSLS